MLHPSVSAIALSCALAMSAPSLLALPIANGGFETPDATGGTELISASGDWIQTGNTSVQGIQRASWVRESGDQGVWLKAWQANMDHSFYQDVAGQAGLAYTLDAGFKLESNFESNGGQLEMALVWLDGSNGVVGSDTLDVDAAVDVFTWTHQSITAAAPATTETVRAFFRWTTDDTIENGQTTSAMVDNVTLTVPEPSAGILSVMASLALCARRRRRSY